MQSGFTLVNFKDEVTRYIILETGVTQFDRKPVILRPWSEDMDTTQMIRSVPVWVKLNDLCLQYWGKKNLSSLVSTIGKPIMAGKVTLERSMIKFVRVLVDVEIKDEPRDKIVKVDVLLEDKQFFHCKLKMVGFKDEFYLMAIYGSNSLNKRKELWSKLASIGHLKEPWIILGDFNAMFGYKDRCGGRRIKDSEIQDSQDWLAQGQVEELKYLGSFFTCDCIIKHVKISNCGTKPFRFSNHWMLKDGYKDTVLSTWRRKKVTDLKSLSQQLFRVKYVLKDYFVTKHEDVTSTYKSAREEYYDLIIFCRGNENYVQLIQEAFQVFSDSTGLVANKSKSTVYFGGVHDDCRRKLLNVLKMDEGTFPFKYLGVQLRPTKWRVADYGIIIDKIHKNLHNWASKNLSFA
uniref:DUF4283 domain-containing protein n=1 Tax=Cannabis sativa TaxID=3483 RepID=A0A803Q9J7_CANSA